MDVHVDPYEHILALFGRWAYSVHADTQPLGKRLMFFVFPMSHSPIDFGAQRAHRERLGNKSLPESTVLHGPKALYNFHTLSAQTWNHDLWSVAIASMVGQFTPIKSYPLQSTLLDHIYL